jgi:hypothetical protein
VYVEHDPEKWKPVFRKSLSLLAMTNNLRLEVADAAGLLADADFEGFLRRRGFGAGFGEIVDEGDDLAFGCLRDRVVGALADGIVRRDLQLFADVFEKPCRNQLGVQRHEALGLFCLEPLALLSVAENWVLHCCSGRRSPRCSPSR